MIEDHVGMSCVWIACCMIEKISKDCKIELCGLLAHSTVHVCVPGQLSWLSSNPGIQGKANNLMNR